jgi:uncharacterized lipoprotein NlpE involved in copper resistance
MKKIIFMFFSFILIFTLIGCNNQKKGIIEPTNTSSIITTTEPINKVANTPENTPIATSSQETNLKLPELKDNNKKENKDLKHLSIEEIKSNKDINNKYVEISKALSIGDLSKTNKETISNPSLVNTENRTFFSKDNEGNTYVGIVNNEKSENGVRIYNIIKIDNFVIVTFVNTKDVKNHIDVSKINVKMDSNTSIAIENINN